MYLGIDISGDTLRHFAQVDDSERKGSYYGICGIPPRFSRERFVWNRPRAIRFSAPLTVLPLADAWRSFITRDNSAFSWTYESGVADQKSMASLVSDAINQNLMAFNANHCVVAVNNNFPESRQESLLVALAHSGITNAKLLWRPIALSLSFLDSYGQQLDAGQKLLVVDAESQPPEATVVELYPHSEGIVLPLRKTPKTDDSLDVDFDVYTIRRAIASDVTDGDGDVACQLCAGPFAGNFIAATEAKGCGDIWYRRNGRYFKLDLDGQALQERLEEQFRKGSVKKLLQAVRDKHDFSKMAAVLWHGWPFRSIFKADNNSKHYLLGEDAVSRGAALYAAKLAQGLPTFLDTLPGLYILSEVKELATFCFFPLVEPSIIEGGRTWQLQQPLSGFNVREGIRQFTAVLRKSDEDVCRRTVTRLPRTPDKDTPVLIRAEARPANGHTLVTIEGAEGHQDIFGDNRRIKLDWETIEEIDIPIVYAPEVYPVRGRLFDEGDSEYMQVLVEFLRNERAGPYEPVKYQGNKVAFHKLLEPWGLKPPWPVGQGQPKGWAVQPARGMFGSLWIPIDTSLTERLGQRIQKIMHQDRVKFMNYMFVYAPETFKNELREKFDQDQPSFVERQLRGRPRPSWNWVIAPGRVFSTSDDFELFVDFMLKQGEDGYPKYPDDTFTRHYWWSFFRCLCYHVDTVNVPPEKILAVLGMIHTFVTKENADGTTLKYCLCAILFSLRMRRIYPDFLQPNDNFCTELIHLIKEVMPRIPYPATMLSSTQDQHGEGLNGLVLRFLMQTASLDDYQAIEGLTTSMA
jgi:hypothetical protein